MKRQNMPKSLDLQYSRIILKLSNTQKERIKRKSHFFLNSFSADEIDDFSELI